MSKTKIYKAVGCVQGYGMDADKFYNVVREYPKATSVEETRTLASRDGIFVVRQWRIS